MKITRSLLLTGVVLLCFQWSFSQAICGFDAVHNRKMKEDASYRRNVLAGEASIRNYTQQHPGLGTTPKNIAPDQHGAIAPDQHGAKAITGSSATSGAITPAGTGPVTLGSPPYTIPVVVHVMHTGGAVGSMYNPDDAQILGAIDYLNKVYNGTWPGTVGAGDLQIQFVLAKRDPNCNPTNGINRVDGSGVPGYVSGGVQAQQTAIGTQDVNVKNLSRWDPTLYYNIWIVNKIDGVDGNTFGSFIAGFAYFPGSPANVDGIVMLATQMVAGQKTLPHEIGHAFNLYHPFENAADPNSATCSVNTSCSTQGDQVCDTDPVTLPAGFVCRTGTNTCTTTAYSTNTESNYMNYTSCYTLFTAGQKARMLAAAAISPRLTLTTSQGGTAPGLGSSPCAIPKIDFELSGDQLTETTAAGSGCRSYKDYSYNMTIGSNPSAAATATLSKTSGTAVLGLDFDFTTNGSFASPSNIVNFPAASSAAQPFTIRVYDDAVASGTRNLVLGFSVGNGGGNAAAGNGRSSFSLIINDNDVAPSGPVATTKLIGTDWGAVQSPFVAASAQNKSQILYYASELQATGMKAGNITGISLYIDKLSGAAFSYQGMTIRCAQTAQTFLKSGGTNQPLADAAFTTVYNSSYSTTDGWNNFTFSTPFAWDGTSNLVIGICYDNGALTDATDQCEGYLDGSGLVNFIFSKVNCATDISSINSYYNGGIKPMIQLAYTNTETAVESVQNSSIQQYLGPNTDIYFYDQTNGQLMARIQNLSSFDYGCTQVVIDRAGSSSTRFWNNNTSNYLMDKTFHVVPTTNNTSGSYNITLYYTKTETDGWQTATGQSLANIQLVKLSGQISSVTPSTPTAGGTMITVTPAISSLGTNTGLSYNFTTGFSGFGAGVPGASILPIGLLNFEGQLENGNAGLDWTTSFEAGSKGFTVERSYDGSHFEDIGYVAAAGNSATPRKYFFTDPSLVQDNNYYRLQQSDLDGKFTYSKVILIKNTGGTQKAFTVLSNPFTDQLDILFKTIPAGNVQVRLLDMTGKELLRQSAGQPGRQLHIDLSRRQLSAGAYLLEIRLNNETFVEKLLKK
ncbi:MAG TPA: M43 family zinc metalloprotease [Puia sp.]|nr:M43 family zinc metalloprotease [Puia sp.]